jgi:hypothetical protein
MEASSPVREQPRNAISVSNALGLKSGAMSLVHVAVGRNIRSAVEAINE